MVLNFPKQAGSSRQLRRIIAGRATLGFFALSTAVAIASMAPLVLQLLKGEERNLSFALSTRTLAVEEYLTRAQDLGKQIASRTRARQILENYEAGDVDFGRVVEVIEETLPPALETSEDASGLVRLTRENEPVGVFGVPISPTLWAIPPLDAHQSLIKGPIEIDNTRYLVISTPILTPTKERVGTDILLFKVDNLQALVEDYTGLGETGEMVLGQLIDGQFELVFPLRHQDRPSEELTQDLQQAIQNKQASNSKFQSKDIKRCCQWA